MEEKNLDQQKDIAILTKIKMQIIFSAIITAILLIMEIYTIINYQGLIIAMMAIGLLIACALFFLISSVVDMNLKTKELERAEFDEIYRAQKASYLIIRKSFDELEERLQSIESASALPADEIINAQKAVAKVTISRNKENTDALMNSNDELINQLFSFQEKMDLNNESLLNKQQALLDATKQDLVNQNRDLQSQFDAIKAQLTQLQLQAAQQPVQQVVYQQPPMMAAPAMAASPVMEQPVMPEPVMPVEEMVMPEALEIPESELSFDDELPELPIDEPAVDLDIDLPIDSVDPEPEETSVGEFTEALEPSVDDLLGAIGAEEPAVDELAIEEIAPEPEPEPASAPVDDDPNKMMSPDDIAALLASMNGDEAPAEEVAPEPEPEPAPAPVDDDPNKMMSPDDIAALLASMNGDAAPAEEVAPEPEPEPAGDPFADTGVDLSDPSRSLSPEEIEKLFASI